MKNSKGRKLGKGKEVNCVRVRAIALCLKDKDLTERKKGYTEALFSKEEIDRAEKIIQEHK